MSGASVSVVIPCFNSAHTVCRALDSVRAQTLPVREVICIDDASDDDTRQAIQTYAACYPDLAVRVLCNETNQGPSVARNRGWDSATSDYIAFLDADDAWHPQKIAIQLAWLERHSQIALCGHAYRINEPHMKFDDLSQVSVEAFGITPSQILLSNPFVPSSVIVRRALPQRFEPTRRYTEDYLLWMQICLDGNGVALLSIPLVWVFKEGDQNLSHNILRMRSGDLDNYWRLWRAQKIGLAQIAMLVPFSLLKFILLITFPSAHAAIKRRLFTQPLSDNVHPRSAQ